MSVLICGAFSDPPQAAIAIRQLDHYGFDFSWAVERMQRPSNDRSDENVTTGVGLIAQLRAAGISESDARFFEDCVARGGLLLSVMSGNREFESIANLTRNGADLGSRSRQEPRAQFDCRIPPWDVKHVEILRLRHGRRPSDETSILVTSNREVDALITVNG